MVAALASEDLWERGGSYGSRVGKTEDGGGWKEMGRIGVAQVGKGHSEIFVWIYFVCGWINWLVNG